MSEAVVAVDVGGTHARFAIGMLSGGQVQSLGDVTTLRTADHPSFRSAWDDFVGSQPGVPRNVAIAVAGPAQGDEIRFTNNPWRLRPSSFGSELNVDRHILINDFEAVGHAVAQADEGYFERLCGPDEALPVHGTISIVGPGTGLGVAHVFRDGRDYRVQSTEGGHMDFAPLDGIDDAILARLRSRYRRVSVERVVSGPAIVDIYETLAALEGRSIRIIDDRAIWAGAMAGDDMLAVAAVERFCLSLGSAAGDLALAQGATGVVIAGGLGLRVRDNLIRSGFSARFVAKGRFESLMAAMPVKLITHPQPGLFGAAAAFARRFSSESD